MIWFWQLLNLSNPTPFDKVAMILGLLFLLFWCWVIWGASDELGPRRTVLGFLLLAAISPIAHICGLTTSLWFVTGWLGSILSALLFNEW